MTNEEAKAYFEMRLSDTVRYANGKQTRQRESFEMAIDALEKQIPKKPIRLGTTNYFACPTCTQGLLLNMGCMNNGCGQAIDWSEE